MDPSVLFVIALVLAILAGLIGGAFRNWFVVGISLIFLAVASWLYAGPAVVDFVAEHWPVLLTASLGYVVAGILYALFRHWRHVNSEPVQYLIKTGLKDWRADPNEKDTPFKDTAHFPRAAMPNKSEILAWMAWWPISLVAYFFGDILRDLFVGVYNKIVGVFTRISDGAVRRAGGE